jgi:ADP-ribosyl-[dinitrogen reductase] hydrolase
MPYDPLTDSWLGALLGLATGDALGTTAEFQRQGQFPTITTITGGGPFGLAAGQWTDDTSMALCLADSLLETETFDPDDQIKRYLRWYQTGYNSPTGRCFDIGTTVLRALNHYEVTRNPYSGETHDHASGNGSIMRLAPVVIAYRRTPDAAIHLAGQSSLTTHGSEMAVDSCRLLAALLLECAAAPRDAPKADLIAAALARLDSVHPRVAALAQGSWRGKSAPDLNPTGFAINTLEAALWAFEGAEDFSSGALAAVNLGGDADTVGAVYGQIAGAYFGLSGIPREWLDILWERERLLETAEALLQLEPSPPQSRG